MAFSRFIRFRKGFGKKLEKVGKGLEKLGRILERSWVFSAFLMGAIAGS